ncbi:MAG: hypothetical protein QF631_08295 [Arenicellales bacterium]|nr:hypothetical protein [Arenicellales bacterium]
MPDMLPYLIAITIAASLLYFLTPIAHNIGLIDKPDSRKHHQQSTPLTGGIAIAFAFGMAALFLPIGLGSYRIFFFSLITVVIIGTFDDHRDISAKIKILFQFAVATLLVLVDDKVVLVIGDIFFSGHSQGLGILAAPFTIIAIVGVINAFNMIDGHDGLTGGVTLISFGVFIYLLNLHSCMVDTHALLYLLATVTTVFLVFNLEFLVGRYRQVFLGDAGSMFLGLVCVYFLINLSREGDEVLNVTSAAWVIGLPLLDMMSVTILRLSKGRSPLKADRLHIHHVLLDLGFGKYTVLVMLLSLHLIFTLIGLFGTLYDWPDGILFWGMFVVLALYIAFNIKTRTQS